MSRPRSRLRRPAVLLAPAAVLTALALSGCDAAGDAVSGAASRAGCEVAQRAVDEVAQQARSTAADLGADPAAAQRRLDGLRETLSAAEQGLDGETREQVTRAREAVEALATQAGQAADGTQVDDVAVQEAEQELDAAVTRLTDVC